jgi:pimeloyl-ACP methyl ester carboxylesterase/lysophospholipase L1-like esterase
MRLTLCLLGLVLGTLVVPAAPKNSAPPPEGRWLFLGDSITYAGEYVELTEYLLLTRLPDRRYEVINLGLPSETASGLSEPNHANGQFPRPALGERLARALAKTKPDRVVACYGMNDGIYHPLSVERMGAFAEGLNRLRQQAGAVGASVYHLTPPVFDAVPIRKRTLPAGREVYEQPYEGYDQVLGSYGEWMLSCRKLGWEVGDIHGPMRAFLDQRRREKPEFSLAGDGVHPNATGHWLMARAAMELLHIPRVADRVSIDARRGRVLAGKVADLQVTSGQVRLAWTSALPLPTDKQWDEALLAQPTWLLDYNRHELQVQGLTQPRYDLYCDDQRLAVLTREELARGASLAQLDNLPAQKRAQELLKVVRERQRLLKDAWLTEVGHLRPGMKQGLPLATAMAQAAALTERIETLRQPVLLRLRLAPSTEPFPAIPADWHGFPRYDFRVGGRLASVVVPRTAAPGRPWLWHGEFFGHKPAPDIALLEQGFHIVYLQVPDQLGSPGAMAHWDRLYQELTSRYQFGPKPALVGLSRGGLYCYNWAAAHPLKVSCIYGDAPVCDFKSWPGGRGKGPGSARDWQLVLSQYGFASEAEALRYGRNPVDNLAPLARARVPLLHVFGDADDVVPWEENTGLVAQRYGRMGGRITLIRKPGVNHHPHGLEDSTPIIEFILQHAARPQ